MQTFFFLISYRREVCGDALVVKKGSAATSLETLPKGRFQCLIEYLWNV